MNWTEKQHGNIKLECYKLTSDVELINIKENESIVMDYATFLDLKELMKDIDME